MFKPTREQAKAKATFHSKVANNPLLGDLNSLSVSKLSQLSGVRELRHWLDIEGFREWLVNDKHNKQLLESAVELAISEAIHILESPCGAEKSDPRPSDKLSALKLILDYAGYAPSKKPVVVEYQDKDIGEMDEEALNKLIDKSLKDQGKLTLAKEK